MALALALAVVVVMVMVMVMVVTLAGGQVKLIVLCPIMATTLERGAHQQGI